MTSRGGAGLLPGSVRGWVVGAGEQVLELCGSLERVVHDRGALVALGYELGNRVRWYERARQIEVDRRRAQQLADRMRMTVALREPPAT